MADSIQAPDFWQTACMATARHAINVLRLAEKPLTPGDVMALIASAPRDAADVGNPEFREKSFCFQCLDRAWDCLDDEDISSMWDVYHEAETHFLEVIPALSLNTRKLLEGSFAGVVRGFGLSDHRLLPVNPSWEERVRYGYGV